MTKITIEVNGYRWLVYGSPTGNQWQTHLIELLSIERLDIPVDKKLEQKLREAVARFLKWEIANIKPISVDLILA